MRIKICGLTRADQAAHAAGCGADFVGVVAAESRRRVTLEEAREVARVRGDFPVRVVGVFQDQPRELVLEWIERVPLDVVPLGWWLGWPVPVLCTHRLKGPLEAPPEDGAAFRLFEIFVEGRGGGPGRTFPVERLGDPRRLGKFFLAGGLNPHNVADRVSALRPFGVDVASGVEASPGVKDPEKVRRFIEEACRAHLG